MRESDLTVDLVLAGAKAYVEKEIVDCSLAIDNGKIFKIGKETTMPAAMIKTDLRNLLVLPGLTDAHVHLRDEGKAYKEDFCSGTAAAAAGGFTTVLDMPNNDPVTMSAETLRHRMKIAEKKVLVNVGFYSEFPRDMSEIPRIVEEGAVAFKLYMTEQVGGLNVDDGTALLEAFKITGRLNALVAVHAEDKTSLVTTIERLKRDGRNDIEAYLEAHSEDVEVKAVKRMLNIVKRTNSHVHFCHVSTENGIQIICDAKKSAAPITCETTPHNLCLSTRDLRRIGTLAVTMPPVREERNVKALWKGVENGCIDILASDHAPHALDEKSAKSIWDVKVGIPGLETALSLLLTEVKQGLLTITDVVRLMSERPAQIFKLNGRGCLKRGYFADLTVVDMKRKYRIDASKFKSKAKYSPFDGWQVEGKPVKTFVNGQLVMNEGEIIGGTASGRVIRRE
jgi:dihydroorotase (multifunctional complex type)